MAPVVSKLEKQCAGNVKFVHVNTDAPANEKLVRQYGVSSIPRYVLIDPSGRVKGDWLGSGPVSRFEPVRQQCNGE